jgi:uncharacterized protein (TIGR03492 family)
LSNGYGEDRSAALIAAALKRLRPDIEVSGAPLITDGNEYLRRHIPVLTRGSVPPSGGFTTLTVKAFLQDLTFNVKHLRYYRHLRSLRSLIDSMVVIGDTFLLVLAHVALRKPTIHFSLSKSDFKNSHLVVEEWVFRRIPHKVLTRDAHTCRSLRDRQIDAHYLGNPMMDDLEPRGIPIGDGRIVGLLPGSKNYSYANFRKMLQVVAEIQDKVEFVCAVSPSLETRLLAKAAHQEGWENSNGFLVRDRQSVHLIKDGFEDVISKSEIIVSLAGTATEQAAGLGKPVVSFTGAGTQTIPKRMKDQQRLLDGAVRYVDDFPRGVAAEVSRLLADRKERMKRGSAGMSRMGPPGASRRIARFLIEELEVTSPRGVYGP